MKDDLKPWELPGPGDEGFDRLTRSRTVNKAIACSRCLAPAGYACTDLAEGPEWRLGWNHEARVRAYLTANPSIYEALLAEVCQ